MKLVFRSVPQDFKLTDIKYRDGGYEEALLRWANSKEEEEDAISFVKRMPDSKHYVWQRSKPKVNRHLAVFLNGFCISPVFDSMDSLLIWCAGHIEGPIKSALKAGVA